jgi:hypothetical protein
MTDKHEIKFKPLPLWGTGKTLQDRWESARKIWIERLKKTARKTVQK